MSEGLIRDFVVQGHPMQWLPAIAERMITANFRKLRLDAENLRLAGETTYPGKRAMTSLIWPQVTIEGFSADQPGLCTLRVTVSAAPRSAAALLAWGSARVSTMEKIAEIIR